MNRYTSLHREPVWRRWPGIVFQIGLGLIFYVTVLYGVALLTGQAVLAALVAGIVVTVLALLWRAYALGAEPARTSTLMEQRWQLTGQSAVGPVVVGFALVTGVGWLAGQLWGMWVYKVQGSALFDDSLANQAQAGIWLVAITQILIAPLGEELLIRGYVYPLLRRRLSVWPALILSAGVFSLLHANLVQILVTVPLGLMMTLAYERTRRIWVPVVLHLGFNVVSLFTPAQIITSIANPVSALIVTVCFIAGVVLLVPRLREQPPPKIIRLKG